ncbi:hypothetical protein ACHAXN_005445 [Cyclotella atomus]
MATAPDRAASEASLLKSLSTIHRCSRSRPRRHSTNDEVPNKQPSPKDALKPQRRATVSHPAAPAIPSRSDNQARLSPTPTAGILKHNDADITATPQNNRVSFSRRQDGSIQTHISSFDVDASPKETANRRLSLRESMNWPPPPPPRTNSADDSCRKSFSAAFRENRMPRLPFATVPACPPPGIPRPLRRYSTMEIEDLTRMNQVKVQGQATATCSMIPPLPFSRRRSDGHLDHSQQQSNNIRTMTSSGARCDYILGDIAKCPSHMIILPETTNDPQSRRHSIKCLN